MQTDMDVLVASYLAFILALLKITLRPTAAILEAAASRVFGSKCTSGECKRFATSIAQPVRHGRDKVTSMSNDKRLAGAVRTLRFFLVKHAGNAKLGRSFIWGSLKLQTQSRILAEASVGAKHRYLDWITEDCVGVMRWLYDT